MKGDVQTPLEEMKNNKATGADEISLELIKNVDEIRMRVY